MPYQCDPCLCPEQHYRDSMSWRKAMITLLCRLIGYISGATPPTPSTAAVFTALASLGYAAIGAAYASITVLPAGTRQVILDNQTNGDVLVSMDGGATDTYHLKGGDKLILNLFALGLTSTADIQLKDGTSGGNTGTFYVYSIV